MKIIVDNFYDPFDYEYFAFLYHRFSRKKGNCSNMGMGARFDVHSSCRIYFIYFLGRGISKEKIFDLKIQGKIGKNLEIEEDKQALMRGLYPHPPTGQVDVKQLIYMLTVFESTLYTTKNEITLFTDGRENSMR